MRVLLANDDGVTAPGIRSLYHAFRDHFETTIIAPLEERSTTGHSLSLDKPLRLERLEENIYGCSGFPADCVLLGVGHLMKNNRPDVVVSGINRGANLGQDLYYSGTVAAARKAAFHRVPSIAVSLVFDKVNAPHHYESAAIFLRWCLEEGLHKAIPPMTLLNVNVPDLSLKEIEGIALTHVGFRRYSEEIHARIDARGREYFWIAGHYEGHLPDPDSDCHAVHGKKIAITPQSLIGSSEREFRELGPIIERLNAKFSS